MTILLLTLSVAFAAFCVWLTVRIVNRRERWAKWTLAAVIGLPVLYVASFGPACWLSSHHTPYRPSVSAVYQPLFAAQFQYPEPIGGALFRYSTAFAAPGATVKMRPDGSCFWSTWEIEDMPPLGGLGIPDRLPGMSVILSIFGVAFAAFSVWLGVRVYNCRERWAKWTLAGVVGVPVLYVASFGPACWWFGRQQSAGAPYGIAVRHVPRLYWPMGWVVRNAGDPVRTAISWYATLRAPVVVIDDGRHLLFMQSEPRTFE